MAGREKNAERVTSGYVPKQVFPGGEYIAFYVYGAGAERRSFRGDGLGIGKLPWGSGGHRNVSLPEVFLGREPRASVRARRTSQPQAGT